MKTILTAALLALGAGLFSATGASAANFAAGVSSTAANATLVQEARFCRTVRTCHRGPYGRRHCEIRRYCR